MAWARIGKESLLENWNYNLQFTLEPQLPLLTPLNFSKGRRCWDALATIKCRTPRWMVFPAKHSQRHFSRPTTMWLWGAAAPLCSPVGDGQSEGHADFPPVHLEGVKATFLEESAVCLTVPQRWPWAFCAWVLHGFPLICNLSRAF